MSAMLMDPDATTGMFLHNPFIALNLSTKRGGGGGGAEAYRSSSRTRKAQEEVHTELCGILMHQTVLCGMP